MHSIKIKYLFTCFILFISFGIKAQPNQQYSSAEILQNLKKLNMLGSVLYVAAHPDDENTRLITWFSKDRLYNTAYLSLTRGDGGQNLIGPELNDQLGLIRTHELIEARKIDGGLQYFSRAKDFGFSKNPDETFDIWNKEEVLADVVWVIRKFRPDVIVTRFGTEPGKTHGHHTASTLLAIEAFDAAADASRFPEQLKHVQIWQAKRVVWNTNSWFFSSDNEFKKEEFLKVDVGEYNPLLGESYTEIAAKSRSMHKSQGFGAGGTRGSSPEYFDHLKGPKAGKDLFEDINTGWSRIEGGQKISHTVDKIISHFSAENPSASVPALLDLRNQITHLKDNYWKEIKLKEVDNVIKSCMGIWIEAAAANYTAIPGQTVKINIELTNRSPLPVEFKSIKFDPGKDSTINIQLPENASKTFSTIIELPSEIKFTQPYWLVHDGTTGMFKVNDQQLIGLPQNPPAVKMYVTMTLKGQTLTYETPVVYKKTDPVKGELYRKFEINPPLYVNPQEKLLVFSDDKPQQLTINLKAAREKLRGKLIIQLPQGFRSEPSGVPFALNSSSDEQTFNFNIYPSANSQVGYIKAKAIVGSDTFNLGIQNIHYDHISSHTLFPESKVKVVRTDIKRKGERIGYIMGAGDEVPTALNQIGYKVTILKEEAITNEILKDFDAVVVGIRAFNTREKMRHINPMLLRYVKAGGTVVVQYNTGPSRFGDAKLHADSIGPYPFKLSNERVTKEDAPVTIVNPKHPLLNSPNKIIPEDFDNWVQERGLYFPNEWAKQYETVVATNDPGESPKEGGILYASYGKGVFIYTSFSWFRQLPAGVPGAYRLFANMLSAGR